MKVPSHRLFQRVWFQVMRSARSAQFETIARAHGIYVYAYRQRVNVNEDGFAIDRMLVINTLEYSTSLLTPHV